MTSLCAQSIQQWMQASTYDNQGNSQGYYQGNFVHISDLMRLQPQHQAHKPRVYAPSNNPKYAQNMLTAPDQHNPNGFCYLVHAVGSVSKTGTKPLADVAESQAREAYMRARSVRFFHPEATADCIALSLSLITEKTVNGIQGSVGYIFPPLELARIVLASNHDLSVKNWSESKILAKAQELKQQGQEAVMSPENILKSTNDIKRNSSNNNEIVAWGRLSRIGSVLDCNDLMPIATFSVLDHNGHDFCPEQSLWMQKHSQDFKIPHIKIPAQVGKPYRNITDSVEIHKLSTLEINVALNNRQYRLSTNGATHYPYWSWTGEGKDYIAKMISTEEMSKIIDALVQKNVPAQTIAAIKKEFSALKPDQHITMAPFTPKVRVLSNIQLLTMT